jgi:hypothetical protein
MARLTQHIEHEVAFCAPAVQILHDLRQLIGLKVGGASACIEISQACTPCGRLLDVNINRSAQRTGALIPDLLVLPLTKVASISSILDSRLELWPSAGRC